MEVNELVEEVTRLKKLVNLLAAQAHGMRSTIGFHAESAIEDATREYCYRHNINPDTGESF